MVEGGLKETMNESVNVKTVQEGMLVIQASLNQKSIYPQLDILYTL